MAISPSQIVAKQLSSSAWKIQAERKTEGGIDMKVKTNCWRCDKAVTVPSDNNNIYTRICKPCKASIPNETPKFYFRVTKSGRAVDL